MNAAAGTEVLVPGAAIGGGFFAGRMIIGTQPYGLIVSPKAEGELKEQAWGPVRKSVVTTWNDGLANTTAMAEAGSKLAQSIRELRIGGCDDWYLMSRQDALLAFYELQAADAFKDDGPEAFERDWYWTSTQYERVDGYAWCQGFGYGGQGTRGKGARLRARAVRRIPL